MTIELTRDRILVLVGDQGTGKTRIAEEIAKPYGQVLRHEGGHHSSLVKAFISETPPSVIIFNSRCIEDRELSLLKELNAGRWSLRCTNSLTIHGGIPVFVIVTTCDERWLNTLSHDYHILPIAEAKRLMGEPS